MRPTLDWLIPTLEILLLAAGFVVLAGCQSVDPLERMQRDIQNCLVVGGHPRLGPDQTVVCRGN